MTRAFLVLSLFIIASACKKTDRSVPAATFSVNYENTADLTAGKSWVFYNVLLPDTTILAPVSGAQQSWEYRDLQQTSQFTVNYEAVAATPDFSTATYSQLMVDTFGKGAVTDVSNSRYYLENTTAGFATLGKTIEQVTLNFDTAGSNITYPTQSIIYSSKIYSAKYPMKLNDTWSGSNIVANYNFTVNAPAYGISNMNGNQVNTMSYNNTVIGSGYMNLKGYDGSVPVLVVKQMMSTQTNYLLNGAPAPAPLLSLIGVTNGAITSSTNYSFYSPVIGYVGTLYMNSANTDVQRAVLRKTF